MKTALIPGSFDPMTVGHTDIIERTAKIFDSVVVAVMINENKRYSFSIEERQRIAELSLAHLENVRVVSYTGWLYELFDIVGADAIVKGIRNANDLEYENSMAAFNIDKNQRAHTLYIPSSEALSDVSSTIFRNTEDKIEAVEKYICQNARSYVLGLIKEDKK